MKLIKSYHRIITVSLIALLAFAQISCGKDRTRTLLKANNAAASALLAVATIIREEETNKIITDAQALEIRQPLAEVQSANAELIRLARAQIRDDVALPQNTSNIFAQLAIASNAIARLNQIGLLHLKNPTKRAEFTALITALDSALLTVSAAVEKGSGK